MNPSTEINFEKFFQKLDSKLDQLWTKILSSSPLAKTVLSGEVTKELYGIYMLETYHYTSHNARNQALVGIRNDIESLPYIKFCLEHAAEEVGHERMALHDIRSIGFEGLDGALPRPLMETEALIAYLYWISFTGNPLQRLGYSYWAESCYKYINPLIQSIQKTLQLEPSQLTFFIAHSDIDADHFEHVKTIIQRSCKSEADLDAIEYVLTTSLKLTARMLDAVYEEYQEVQLGRGRRYDFLCKKA
ncbi:iron-containing redox enzyme family protein [Chitiniphilus purpureus]|uniref:Iron-containing redox enzyme family protein n=1 Tax=Chitiniphilus purpureus TaxID=2981137 RepID=A0ABY6DLG1_9NEIS|nr:iron-containing redox enzyme family protein [Chitiniphilus sp. CD1]UXY15181.1 iron-containing redox enzyme family protein [Chitiniphilus sp. CD1]